MRVLGIETSCDETAAAVVEDGRRIISNVVVSQIDIHRAFGGVVPEVAARSHIEAILPVIDRALADSADADMKLDISVADSQGGRLGLAASSAPLAAVDEMSSATSTASDELANPDSDPWSNIDAIAVSTHPGLIGSLLIGTLTARTLALLKNKPLFPIDHVEAHVYANFLTETPPQFPILALVASGGHTQIVLFKNHGDYRVLGATRDDAVGEAFDKVAKILGLPYPGGPAIAEAALEGDPQKYHLPKPKLDNPYDFSFSGLKTATLRAVQADCGKDYTFSSNALSGLLTAAQQHDFAASFQNTAVEILVDKLERAYQEHQPRSVVLAGGVAANQELRRQLSARLPIQLHFPVPELCTDNAAMVASLGYFKAQTASPADPRSVSVSSSLLPPEAVAG